MPTPSGVPTLPLHLLRRCFQRGPLQLGTTKHARSMTMGRRSLGARVFAWAAVASFCISGATISYSDDAWAQKKPKKPKKPQNTQQEIELDQPAPANPAPGTGAASGAAPGAAPKAVD